MKKGSNAGSPHFTHPPGSGRWSITSHYIGAAGAAGSWCVRIALREAASSHLAGGGYCHMPYVGSSAVKGGQPPWTGWPGGAPPLGPHWGDIAPKAGVDEGIGARCRPSSSMIPSEGDSGGGGRSGARRRMDPLSLG